MAAPAPFSRVSVCVIFSQLISASLGEDWQLFLTRSITQGAQFAHRGSCRALEIFTAAQPAVPTGGARVCPCLPGQARRLPVKSGQAWERALTAFPAVLRVRARVRR